MTSNNSKNINGKQINNTISVSCPIDNYRYSSTWPTSDASTKTTRTLSCHEPGHTNNNRFKHLCTRLRRRFSISKDDGTRRDGNHKSSSICLSNYETCPSSTDDFEWPDFEEVYDQIPTCLVNALPGLGDLSLDDDDDDDGDNSKNTPNFLTDEKDEQFKLYQDCKRGKYFRRNGICRKLDKSQYRGQLNTFIQQLMIEKLIRTWT